MLAEAVRAVKTLGIERSDLHAIVNASTSLEALEAWRQQLEVFRTYWLQAVFEAHPDRGGTSEAFDEVQKAWSLIKTESFARALWTAGQSCKAKREHRMMTRGLRIPLLDFTRSPAFVRRFNHGALR